jgi:hypothetical protein
VTGEAIKYRRTVLYDEVWKDPVRTVASRYGVSDVALAKICRKLKVPLPWSGYWAQVRAGQQVSRPPLPPVPVGVPSEILSWKLDPPATDGVRKERPPVERTIVVPHKLQKPHALVSEAARLLRGRQPHDGLLSCRTTRCLDISVGPASLGRALRIMNALLRALEKRGLHVEVTRALANGVPGQTDGAPSNATRVQVADEWIQWGLTEKRTLVRERAPEPPRWLTGRELESWLWTNRPERKLVSNGIFELSIVNAQYLGVRTVWQDRKRKRVEDCLDEFIAHLYLAAEAVKQHREELERARRQRQEEELCRFEREQERRKEEARAREFEEELRCWRLARDAREYAAEIRGVLEQIGAEHPHSSALARSLAWIEGFAWRIDPLSQLRVRSVTSAISQIEAGEREPDRGVVKADSREVCSGGETSEGAPASSEDEP